jgi:hypothetical protein
VAKSGGTAADYLESRRQRLAELLAELARDVDSLESVTIDKHGELHLTALEAVVPEAAKALQRRLERRIPLISLPDLLNEVHGWTGCFRHFTHLVTGEVPDGERLLMLIAATMALGMNHGLGKLARSTPFSARSPGRPTGTSARTRCCRRWSTSTSSSSNSPSQLTGATGPAPPLTACASESASRRPNELRAHAPALRATLVASLCWLREREVTDSLVDLLIQVIHKINVRAEKRVEKELLDDFKRVTGKVGVLFDIAEASVEQPDGRVRDVVFPAAGGEQKLRDLVREYESNGPAFRFQVHTYLRASYASHYRRMGPATAPGA